VQLEREQGIPCNPLINAGAIVVTDAPLAGRVPRAAIGEILDTLRALAGDPGLAIDAEVARSETDTGYRNACLTNFMRAFGNITNPVDCVPETCFNQCALRMSCVQRARAGLFLANDGIDPIAGPRVVDAQAVRRIDAIMMTCGHYDTSGDSRSVSAARQERHRRRHSGACPAAGGCRRVVAWPQHCGQLARGSAGAGEAGAMHRLVRFLSGRQRLRLSPLGILVSYAPGAGSLSNSLTARRRNFICSSTVRQVWQITK
jgi:hypothetical protein